MTREVPNFCWYWLTIAYAPACNSSRNFQIVKKKQLDRSVFRSAANRVSENQKYSVDFRNSRSSWQTRIFWLWGCDLLGGSPGNPTKAFFWLLSPLQPPATAVFSPHVTSIVPGIDEGLNILQIVYVLGTHCFHLHDFLGLYLARDFSHDNNGRLKTGVQALDRLHIIWKGTNHMGTLGTSTMEALVSTLAPRQHLRQEKDVGRAALNALNNIMILLHTDARGRVSNLKFEAPPAASTPIRSVASFGV